ncbi:MAG TPA: hypothetical protein VFP84_35685 [Kofleriaceae bacterium]|nr:hypothetical protein [Kofleriaceae bacterium]
MTAMTSAAWAQDSPPAAGEAAPAAAPPAAMPEHAAAASHRFTGDKTSYYVSGNAGDSPFLNVGLTLASGWSFAIGGSLQYNGSGHVGGSPGADDKFAVDGLLYASYYIYNKFPVGVAVEAALISPFNPNTFQQFTVQPGLVLYYAPFPAPLVIGSGLDFQATFFRGDLGTVQKTIINTVTPGVRLIYVFP